MDRLASCYFCGDAVDAQLQEYSLVTSDRLETGRTVVLCPSCRQKLTTVVEDVLDAAIDGGSTTDGPSVDLDDDPLETLEQPTDEGHMTATDVEPIDGDGDTPSDDRAADAAAMGDRETTDDATVAGDEATSDNDETAGDEPVLDGDSAENGPTSDEGSAERESTSGESSSERGSTSDDGSTGQSTAADDAAVRSDSTDEQAGNSQDGADFERAEYNKVVKLLQNREFPVEIEEITVVARSAYGIDRNTTHAILDALIDRGVLEDRGDELVRT